jgi:hypothetical protein
VSYGQHLLRGRGWSEPVCGNDDDDEPIDSISAVEFVSQLGRATGRALAFDSDVCGCLFCSLCVTKFIAEETGATGI